MKGIADQSRGTCMRYINYQRRKIGCSTERKVWN
nr:MAG TPA: hypothetical protein [Caudoviricetes sp.]